MSPEALSAIAGTILSLGMTYIPGINAAYARLSPGVKQSIMGVLILAAATLSAFWACQGTENACAEGVDWRAWIGSVIAALVANQGTDRISPEPEAVKEVKGEG